MAIGFGIYVLGFTCGSTFMFFINYYKKHRKDRDTEIKEETTTNDVFIHAEDMFEISKECEDKVKFNIIKDLMCNIRLASEMGQHTWYAQQSPSVAKNVKEHLTQQEVLEVLEPLGYKVSFTPSSSEANLLIIQWKKD